jgi:hypothetical protein
MKRPGVEIAVKTYWDKFELETADIKELFEASNSGASRLKKQARALMAERNVLPFSPTAVVTEVAFEAWGLDINRLEERYKKLKRMGLLKNEEQKQI